MNLISDLACELLRRSPQPIDGITVTTTHHRRITVNTTTVTTAKAAQRIGKPIGTYINLETNHATPTAITRALAAALSALFPNPSIILIIGLGNDKIVADSLGPCVLNQIQTGKQRKTFAPNVFGVTGINSVDAIQAINHLVRPHAVIVIDSLVSATPTRIGTNYQICTSGITPGSGIGRNNHCINQALLGVPVIAIGVPVCTIMSPAPRQIYHVVPKDIDLIIRDCAHIIAAAINTLA